MLLETKKASRINPKRLSSKSLVRYARRTDAVGATARAELVRREAAKPPKVSKTMKELEDALVAGRAINADAIKHIHSASHHKVAAAINKANARKQKAKDERKISGPYKKEIAGLEKELAGQNLKLKVSGDAYKDLRSRHNSNVSALNRSAMRNVLDQRDTEKKKETGEIRGPSLWHRIKKAVVR